MLCRRTIFADFWAVRAQHEGADAEEHLSMVGRALPIRGIGFRGASSARSEGSFQVTIWSCLVEAGADGVVAEVAAVTVMGSVH